MGRHLPLRDLPAESISSYGNIFGLLLIKLRMAGDL